MEEKDILVSITDLFNLSADPVKIEFSGRLNSSQQDIGGYPIEKDTDL